MTLKWKIFFALNILLALSAFILLILLFVALFSMNYRIEYYLSFAIFIFALSIMPLNSFLNIFLLQRYYPDKLISKGIKKLYLLLLTLTGIIILGMLIICIYAGAEEFDSRNADRDANRKIVLLILFIAMIIQIIIFTMQIQLLALIKRNNQKSMHSLIDSIGQ